MANTSLNKAKAQKNDEFYTKLEDVEKELSQYTQDFIDKTIYLPCDNTNSAFWIYLTQNYNTIKFKKLIATTKAEPYGTINMYTDGFHYQSTLDDDGDFVLSEHCQRLIDETDIIITNPPFSKFRPFLAKILENQKQFLIIGNQNAFKYKDIFPLFKDNIIWTGYNMVKEFYQPDGSTKSFGNVCWFTNMPTTRRNSELPLKKEYSPDKYPEISNYKGAINVNRLTDIPKDWNGLMGVPITYIDKHCPTQFKIVDCCTAPIVNGIAKYSRIIIQKINS